MGISNVRSVGVSLKIVVRVRTRFTRHHLTHVIQKMMRTSQTRGGIILINDNVEKIFNKECLKLINSKNSDYANPTDFYANFRLCEQAGVPMFIGIHVRMLDKISRLNSFLERFNRTGKITANHESIEDTLLDTINYAAIMLDTYRQWERDEKNNGKIS